VSQSWKYTFDDDQRHKGHRSSACNGNFIDSIGYSKISSDTVYRSEKSGEYGIQALSESPCGGSKVINRYYPTWDGRFDLPALIMFWLYVDAPDWNVVTDNRFSQSTFKGRNPKEGEIVTTHIHPNGSIDIGHARMTFRNEDILVPLKKWNLQSMYIDIDPDKMLLKAFIDDSLAVIANQDLWAEQQLRHWHMGLYQDLVEKYPSPAWRIFNDDIQIVEVKDENEAENLIDAELGDLVDPGNNTERIEILVNYDKRTTNVIRE